MVQYKGLLQNQYTYRYALNVCRLLNQIFRIFIATSGI